MEEKKRFIRFDYMTNNEVGLPLGFYVSEIRRFGDPDFLENPKTGIVSEFFHQGYETQSGSDGRDI